MFVWISGRLLAPTSPLRWVVLLPVLAGALDLVENSGILTLLTFSPSELGAALGFITAAKLILVNLCTVSTVLGLVVVAVVAVLGEYRRMFGA